MKIIKNPQRIWFLSIFLILIAAAALYFIQSKNDRPNKADESNSLKTSSRVQVENGITTICLTPEEQVNSGITTVKLARTSYQAQSTAFGSVVSIKDLSADVQGFEAAKAQLAKSEENLLISQKNFERVKSLYEKKFASQQDFQTSQAAYLSDKADLSSAKANLSNVKSSIAEQWGDGISKWILSGSAELQRLLNLNESLIQISLTPEENLKAPAKIFIQSPSENNKRILCGYVSSGRIANSQFQTRTFYYIASGSSLSGGMNVKAFLPVGNNLSGVIVPASSIVWYRGGAWAYIEKSSNKFIRVEINTDNPAGDGFFVPVGKVEINPGEKIVTNGAQLLLSQELVPAQTNSNAEGDND